MRVRRTKNGQNSQNGDNYRLASILPGWCDALTHMLKARFIHIIARLSRIRAAMTDSCIFCKIISNETKAAIVYRDD